MLELDRAPAGGPTPLLSSYSSQVFGSMTASSQAAFLSSFCQKYDSQQSIPPSALRPQGDHSPCSLAPGDRSTTSASKPEPAAFHQPDTASSPEQASSDDSGSQTPCSEIPDEGKKATSRKTEQNRRAQQRYRRRKREMFEEQQRLNAELSMHLEHLLHENSNTQARANYLEEILDQASRESSDDRTGMGTPKDTSLISFAEAMLELVHVLQQNTNAQGQLQPLLLHAAADLLTGNESQISFIRKALVVQLGSCILDIKQQQSTAALARTTELIHAHVNMVQRAGASNAQATLAYLALPVQPDLRHCQAVLEAGQLSLEQKQQFMDAHTALLVSMRHLAEGCKPHTAVLQSAWPAVDCQAQNLAHITRAKEALDFWQRLLAEQQQCVLDFYCTASLVLHPLQHARMMVTAFPAGIDMMAICSLLVDHRKQHAQSGSISHGVTTPLGVVDQRSSTSHCSPILSPLHQVPARHAGRTPLPISQASAQMTPSRSLTPGQILDTNAMSRHFASLSTSPVSQPAWPSLRLPAQHLGTSPVLQQQSGVSREDTALPFSLGQYSLGHASRSNAL